MNALLQTHTFLSDCLIADPLLRLAHTVAWLDPLLWSDADEDADEEGDELETALRITRQVFPDVYAEAVEAIQAGATYNQLHRLICNAFDHQGLSLDSLEFIGWGIPLPAYGVELEDLDFYREDPDTLPVLELFGVRVDGDHVHVPEDACRIGAMLAASLESHTDIRYHNLAWLLCWLWSCSGNTLVDWSYEALCEIPPLSWTPDDVAFAKALIAEADEVMQAAMEGLKLLQTESGVMDALRRNIAITAKAIKKRKIDNDRWTIQLDWPRLECGDAGAADADTAIL